MVNAAVQLGAVVVVLAMGVVGAEVVGDRLRAVPLAALYGLPPALALLALPSRGSLLPSAGVSSLVLAVFPFSLHSFVFGPVGLVYLAVHARWRTRPQGGRRSAAAAAAVSLLLVVSLLALLWHDDPICYTKDTSGEITIDRDPGPDSSGTRTIDAGSDIVESGCSSDTVVWWEAATSLALSGTALATAVRLTRPTRPRAADSGG